MQKSYSLQELAAKVGGTLRGNADVVVNNIAALSKAEPNQLTFISNAKFRPLLAESKAGILVVSEADVEFCSPESNLLIVKDPYVAYAVLAQYMDTTPKAAQNIHPSVRLFLKKLQLVKMYQLVQMPLLKKVFY